MSSGYPSDHMDNDVPILTREYFRTIHEGDILPFELPKVNFSRYATILAAIASIVFVIIGVAGNLVTIIALSRSAKLRSHATTAFVISLCISDLLFCTINLPLTASRYIHEEWVLGDVLCRVFPFIFYVNVAASLMNMVAITLNRYILIAHHSIYDRIYGKRNILIMIALIWIFCFGMMTPPLLGVWGRLGLDEPTFSCTIIKQNDSSPKHFLLLFGFLFPCIAIIVCYSAIYYKVKQSRKKMASHAGPRPTQMQTAQSNKMIQARKEDMRLTRMMLIIFVGFILCFLPLTIVNVADDIHTTSVPNLHVLASVLAWASAVINPFVYAFTNRQYRTAYKKLFFKDGGRRKKDSSAFSKSNNSSKTLMTEFQYQASTGVVTSHSLPLNSDDY